MSVGAKKIVLKYTKVYCTRYSQAVTHPSTNRARRCLTSVIGREPVLSTWYGRRRWLIRRNLRHLLYCFCTSKLILERRAFLQKAMSMKTHFHLSLHVHCTTVVKVTYILLN